MCVIPFDSGALDPCEWSQPAAATMTAAGPASALQIKLAQGATIHFHFDDPAKILPIPGSTGSARFFRAGFWTADATFHQARHVYSTATAHEYEIAVPYNTDLKLWMDAIGLQVFDTGNVRADGVRNKAIQVPRGKDGPTYRFRIADATTKGGK